MGILWGAEAALWLYLVHQARGTELLFMLWRAQDRPWHWTQTWQAARGHIPKYVRARACYEPRHARPPISRDRGEHEMLGWRRVPAAGVSGLCSLSEELRWRTIMRRLKLHSGARGSLARMADDQLIMWERISWLCTGHR